MTTFDPRAATTDQLRDWLAERDGWVRVKDSHGGDAWRKRSLLHDPCSNWSHPYPPTIDAAERALPEKMRAERTYCQTMIRWEWWVWQPNPDPTGRPWALLVDADNCPVGCDDTGDELHNRFLLAVLARMAGEGNK